MVNNASAILFGSGGCAGLTRKHRKDNAMVHPSEPKIRTAIQDVVQAKGTATLRCVAASVGRPFCANTKKVALVCDKPNSQVRCAARLQAPFA